MLKSMTGFGQALAEHPKFNIKAELKALNGKFMELNLRLPKILQGKEMEIRNLLQRKLERGTVTLSMSIDFRNSSDLLQPINKEVVNFYLQELSLIESNLGIEKGKLSGSVFTMPNALQSTEQELDENDWALLQDCILQAFERFDQFRKQEGKETAAGITAMVQRIAALCDEVEQLEPERIAAIRLKIKTDLDNYLQAEQVDQNRFEQELVYYIEKIDIAEEKLRLRNHCQYFLQTMQEDSAGKKLGFIAQEMGREINTIGAKANFFEMQKRIVQMKDELEKIKEQLNNIV